MAAAWMASERNNACHWMEMHDANSTTYGNMGAWRLSLPVMLHKALSQPEHAAIWTELDVDYVTVRVRKRSDTIKGLNVLRIRPWAPQPAS